MKRPGPDVPLRSSSKPIADDHNLARRVEMLEAAMFRLTAELDRLRASGGEPAPSSSRSQQIVFEAVTRRIEADGGETRATAGAIAAEVGLHQTYVAAILKTLEAEGRLVVTGKRARSYRLPDVASC